MDSNVEYFLGCLKESLSDMTCDRVENQIMQVMGFGGNRLLIEKKDVESLFCNLVSIILKEVDTSDEGYVEFVNSFKRSYDSILYSKYKEGIRELQDNNNKSFIIVPILATTPKREAKHMFFAVVTKVLDKYNCILVNKGYRPGDAFTYQKCTNRSYRELVDIFDEDKLFTVEEIYRQLSDINAEGVNAMDQKVGNCICKNMEASINSALCIAYPKYKKYGRIPAGVSDKVEVHRMYIDNLRESMKDIPQFRGFEYVVEDKWKEYIYNKKFAERMNKIRRRYLEKKIGRNRVLEEFEDKYLKNELCKIEIENEVDDYSNPIRDKWMTYIYNKAFEKIMDREKNEYVADDKEFLDAFLENFKEENTKDRLKYVSAKTLFDWYDNFLIFLKRRIKKANKVLYLVDRIWLDRYELPDFKPQELDIAVYFLKDLKEYFPMAVRELQLYYSKAYLRIGKLRSENKWDVESLKLYQSGVRCNPYKMELEQVFEDIYKKMLNRRTEPEDNEYRFILSMKDRSIYELLNSDYMKGKEKVSQSLDYVLLKNKESIKKAFLDGHDSVNYLKISDMDLSEIKSDIEEMNYNDDNNLIDILARVFDMDILKCINFNNVNRNKLFFKGLKEGNFELTNMLVNWGIDLNIEDLKGNTPLMLACMGGNKDNVELIFGKNAKLKEKYIGGCNIIRFIGDCNIKIDIAKILIDKMGTKEELDSGFIEMDNNPVLMYACRKNNVDLVKVLLECDVDVNKTDKYGNTALKDICSMSQNPRNIEIVRLLLENNADVNKENYRKVTALMMASCNENVEFVKMLLLAGADVNKKNKNNRTALDMAIDNDNEEIIKLLEDNMLTKRKKENKNIREMCVKKSGCDKKYML